LEHFPIENSCPKLDHKKKNHPLAPNLIDIIYEYIS
jgi:hypothetical protein